MGLSVVHGIIKKHKGSITVSSTPGEGTIFNIYLPALNEGKIENKDKAKLHNLDDYRGQGETVLLVEDEEAVLNYLENMLGTYGYNYFSTTSGEEALKILANNKDRIDLLISDVILTGMDGVRLAENLKKEKADLNIILSSGYSDKKVSQRYIRERGFKFIQKPYNIVKLLKTIREILEQ
mgnify:FL=1